jgi:hypothetical protein
MPSASVIITKYVPRARTTRRPKNTDAAMQAPSAPTMAAPSDQPLCVVRIATP